MTSSCTSDTSCCGEALHEFIQSAEAGRIPCIMLRPRGGDGDAIFQGDFDFLMDEGRFDQILQAVFSICQTAGVSFIVRQSSPFKRQIELLDERARRVTIELWTHAELRVRGSGGRLTRAGVSYGAYEQLCLSQREALLAALFLLHLHHKRKDLGAPLVRDRLAYFADRCGNDAALRGAMHALLAGTLDLDGAQQAGMAFLRQGGIAVIPPVAIALRRLAWRLWGALHWPSWRTTAVVGPNGSGKTSLIEDLRHGPAGKRYTFKRFKRMFRKPLFYWGREPRNVRDENRLWLILPVAWAVFSISGLWAGWRRPLMLDRYFYDYFVRNVRTNRQHPVRRIAAYGVCSALAPRPRRLIVASCPPDIIEKRKQELPRDAIVSLYGMYLDQVRRGRLPATLFCYTGASPEMSGRHVLSFLGDPEAA
ncbi:hypothetical protein ACL598_25600 [Bordetella bronchialis]|uniref:hypothetical protein n=1 Tax=Bordetella bronchialis TaxID=463025 RepID=UPI003CFEB770